MSALEIIEQIKSLPPDEKAEVVSLSTRSKEKPAPARDRAANQAKGGDRYDDLFPNWRNSGPDFFSLRKLAYPSQIAFFGGKWGW